MTALLQTNDIKTAIKWIKTTGKKFDNKVHETAVQTIMHAQQHGDVTLVQSLLNAMPKSGRAEALAHWVREFTPLTVLGKAGNFSVKLSKKSVREYKIDDAEATPFYELTADMVVTAYTLQTMHKQLATILRKGNEALATVDTDDEQAVQEAEEMKQLLEKVEQLQQAA